MNDDWRLKNGDLPHFSFSSVIPAKAEIFSHRENIVIIFSIFFRSFFPVDENEPSAGRF